MWWPFSRRREPEKQEPRFLLPRAGGVGNGIRGFGAATSNLLTADFPTALQSGNAALRPALRTMRIRSRHLAENNDYMKAFLGTLQGKVLGPDGMRLNVRAMRPDGVTVDQKDSDYLEAQFAEWARAGNCTTCGRYSFTEVQRLVLRTEARDGEVLVRLVRNFPSKWGFALQLLEGDVLDEQLNVEPGSSFAGVSMPWGNEIRMGVERDPWQRIVAYHVLSRHPGDEQQSWQGITRYQRIAAADVLHVFVPDRLDDARGAPWAWTAIRRLQMAGGYEEAELVAARLGAAKGGFITTDGDDVPGDSKNAAGETVNQVDPGEIRILAKGQEFTAYDPTHPNSNFGAFLKAVMRGAAAGLGVSYSGLTRDLESVNFGSLRQGELDERDQWRLLQGHIRQALCEPVYSAWLDMGLLTGAIALPPSKREKFDADVWHGRGWPWIDPQKDIDAELAAVALGVRSLTQICAERGVDYEDVLRERKREIELAKTYGVEVGMPARKPLAPEAPTVLP